MENLENLEDFKLDVLKEVGNIGSGNAATALSRLLNKPVDMGVPKVQMLPFEEIAEKVGGNEQLVVAIFFRVEGEAPGNLFFILQPHAAKSLLSRLANIPSDDEDSFNEMEHSALSEIGNILAGSYLSSLVRFHPVVHVSDGSRTSFGYGGAILSYGLLQFGQMGDAALLIDTTFLEGQNQIEGQFFLIPDPESFGKIFRSLGVPMNDD